MTSEAVGIDSESLLFAKLQEHKFEIPNLISRRLYNDRRKITSSLCNTIRERMAKEIDGDEDCFCIDSKPIEVCRFSRSKHCSMGKKNFEKAPSIGYCASQGVYYYGYKLHAVRGLSGVIHSFDLTKASVHDIHYLEIIEPVTIWQPFVITNVKVRSNPVDFRLLCFDFKNNNLFLQVHNH